MLFALQMQLLWNVCVRSFRGAFSSFMVSKCIWMLIRFKQYKLYAKIAMNRTVQLTVMLRFISLNKVVWLQKQNRKWEFCSSLQHYCHPWSSLVRSKNTSKFLCSKKKEEMSKEKKMKLKLVNFIMKPKRKRWISAGEWQPNDKRWKLFVPKRERNKYEQ